jgi:hypothetical protein
MRSGLVIVVAVVGCGREPAAPSCDRLRVAATTAVDAYLAAREPDRHRLITTSVALNARWGEARAAARNVRDVATRAVLEQQEVVLDWMSEAGVDAVTRYFAMTDAALGVRGQIGVRNDRDGDEPSPIAIPTPLAADPAFAPTTVAIGAYNACRK